MAWQNLRDLERGMAPDAYLNQAEIGVYNVGATVALGAGALGLAQSIASGYTYYSAGPPQPEGTEFTRATSTAERSDAPTDPFLTTETTTEPYTNPTAETPSVEETFFWGSQTSGPEFASSNVPLVPELHRVPFGHPIPPPVSSAPRTPGVSSIASSAISSTNGSQYRDAIVADLYNRNLTTQARNMNSYDEYADRILQQRIDLKNLPMSNPSLMAVKEGGLLPLAVQPIVGRSWYPENPGLRNLTDDVGGLGSVQGMYGGEREQYGYPTDYRYHHSYDNERIKNRF